MFNWIKKLFVKIPEGSTTTTKPDKYLRKNNIYNKTKSHPEWEKENEVEKEPEYNYDDVFEKLSTKQGIQVKYYIANTIDDYKHFSNKYHSIIRSLLYRLEHNTIVTLIPKHDINLLRIDDNQIKNIIVYHCMNGSSSQNVLMNLPYRHPNTIIDLIKDRIKITDTNIIDVASSNDTLKIHFNPNNLS